MPFGETGHLTTSTQQCLCIAKLSGTVSGPFGRRCRSRTECPFRENMIKARCEKILVKIEKPRSDEISGVAEGARVNAAFGSGYSAR